MVNSGECAGGGGEGEGLKGKVRGNRGEGGEGRRVVFE